MPDGSNGAVHAHELAGKSALVTGGTKGVGEAVVRRLMYGGAAVATAARNPPPADQRPDLFGQADVGTPESVARIVEAVMVQWGSPDWLVHVVGGSSAPAGGIAALDDAE